MDADGALDLVVRGPTNVAVFPGNEAGTGDLPFRRGDADGNGRVTVADAVAILQRFFPGWGWPACEDAADVNDDGTLDGTDAISILSTLFRRGDPPPSPGPGRCGLDPTEDGLSCVEYAACRD
jgi:hypothetical protein